MATYFVPHPPTPHTIPFPSRDQIAGAIEVMVAVLDSIDGDPDVELNGDELDGSSGAEDEFEDHSLSHMESGAGCPISDPGEDGCDAELETWSHPDDHPSELFVGHRQAYSSRVDR